MDIVSNQYGGVETERTSKPSRHSKTERDSQKSAAKSNLQRVIMIGGNKHIGNYRILDKVLGEGAFGKVKSKYFVI